MAGETKNTRKPRTQTLATKQAPAIADKEPPARVSNVAKIDPKDPIPFEYGGNTFSWIHQAAYLPFLPPLDNYGQNLLEARLLSTTHNACVRTKKDYCAGAGFHDANNKDLTLVPIDEHQKRISDQAQ